MCLPAGEKCFLKILLYFSFERSVPPKSIAVPGSHRVPGPATRAFTQELGLVSNSNQPTAWMGAHLGCTISSAGSVVGVVSPCFILAAISRLLAGTTLE